MNRNVSFLNVAVALLANANKWRIMTNPREKIIEAIDYTVRYLMDVRREIAEEMQKSREKPLQGFLAPKNGGVGGRLLPADKASVQMPTTPPQNGDEEGHCPDVDATTAVAPTSSPPQRDGGGHTPLADKATIFVPTPSLPLSAVQRSANIRAAVGVAISVLDACKVRDGRPLARVRWFELLSLAKEDERSAVMLRAIHASRVPDDPNKYVCDLISAREVEQIMVRVLNGVETDARAA